MEVFCGVNARRLIYQFSHSLLRLLFCRQRAKKLHQGVYNLNKKSSEIQIQISGLIRIRLLMSAGSLSKMLWIHYVVGVSDFAEYPKNRPVTI